MQDVTDQIYDGTIVPEWGTIAGHDDYMEEGPTQYHENSAHEHVMPYAPTITIEMLNRVPKFKELLFEQMAEELEDMLVPWNPDATELEEDEYYEQQIMTGINMDPQIQCMVLEVLTNPDDCLEQEGEPMYRPSIMDSSIVHVGVQYREDHPEVPAKYDHLSEVSISRIYSDPQLRSIVSKMPMEQITDAFIDRFSKK